MLDIEIVRAGKRGFRPGVVAIEYIDYLSVAIPMISPVQRQHLLLHIHLIDQGSLAVFPEGRSRVSHLDRSADVSHLMKYHERR